MFEIIITGFVVTIGGGFGLYKLQQFFDNRISIKRITSSDDKHVKGLTDLYDYHFSEEDGTNYTVEEIEEMVNAKYKDRRIAEVENINFVAVLKNEVVGFILCHLYPQRRKAIVSYFAVKDGVDYYEKVAHKLLAKLKSCLIKGDSCNTLFFEIQGFDLNTPKPEQSKRRSLRRLFSREAKSFGLKVREFDFQYQCPKVSLSVDSHESPFSLFCVGLQEPIPNRISKHQMIEILEFIYLECYGDLYPVNDRLFLKHQAHLQELLEYYENILPDVIQTVEGGRKIRAKVDEQSNNSMDVRAKQLPSSERRLLP